MKPIAVAYSSTEGAEASSAQCTKIAVSVVSAAEEQRTAEQEAVLEGEAAVDALDERDRLAEVGRREGAGEHAELDDLAAEEDQRRCMRSIVWICQVRPKHVTGPAASAIAPTSPEDQKESSPGRSRASSGCRGA